METAAKTNCQICGKSFSTAQNRNIHLRTHTQEKPYSCDICSKSFSTAQNRNIHERTHSGEKPYSWIYVVHHLLDLVIGIDTEEHILKKNHIHVKYVVNHLLDLVIGIDT